MSRNGSGIYILPAGQPVITGTTISSTTHNTLMTDLANALTTSLATDGQTAMSANLPMGGNKATGLGAATVAGDAARYEQIGALAIAQGAQPAGLYAASGRNNDILSLAALDAQTGFRNLLINGNFNFNQRGYVSGTATVLANQYTLDVWRVIVSGQSLGYSTFGNGRVVTAPAGGIEQIIDGASIGVSTGVINWSGTATCTIDGAAKTKGQAFLLVPGSNCSVKFFGGTVYVAQAEPGIVATPFEFKPVATELVLCQRLCQQFNAVLNGAWGIGTIAGGGTSRGVIQHLVQMRVPPITTFNGSGFGAEDNGAATSSVSFTSTVPTVYSTTVLFSHAALTSNAARRLFWSDSTSSITLSADF